MLVRDVLMVVSGVGVTVVHIPVLVFVGMGLIVAVV